MDKVQIFLLGISIFSITACGYTNVPAKHHALPVSTASSLKSPQQAQTDTANTLHHEVHFPVKAGIAARAFVYGDNIWVSAGGQSPSRLSAIHPPLFTNWRSDYFKVADYDQDGLIDLAILISVDHGGQNRCYAIYRYDPQTSRFRQRRSFDRCNI